MTTATTFTIPSMPCDKEILPSYAHDAQEKRVSSTFFQDFTIAERFGASAVRETFGRAFGEWKSSAKYLTELVMVLNAKCWAWHDAGDERWARLYAALYGRASSWACDNLTGDDARFYFEITD